MQIIDNIPVWGTQIDEGALKQIRTCYWIFGQAAMMADHHKGYGVPIGGVIAHEYLISPSGVGYDIGCGNKAVLTDADAQDVRANIARIMDDVWSTVSFGIGRKNREDVDHELFENDDAWQITQGANTAAWKLTSLRDMARAQLGTVGSGNHYVDILQDEQERIWVGVHFGSRGFGHKIATRFLNRAGAKDDMDSAPVALDARTAGRPGLYRRHEAGWPVCLCRPRLGMRSRREDSWRQGTRLRPQPSQFCVAGDARRKVALGSSQRCNAGISWAARICRRHDGRKLRDS